MTIGQKNYANFLDDLEERVKSGKYKPKWADRKTIDKKHPQAKSTSKSKKSKATKAKVKRISKPIPTFGVRNKEGKLNNIDLDELPKITQPKAIKQSTRTTPSSGDIHVKGFCVKSHMRNKNGKTINVKGYCVKAHTRRRRN